MLNLVLENNKYLELKDCLYVPKFRKNSISISSLNRLDYSVYFNKKNIKKMIHLFAHVCWLTLFLYHSYFFYYLLLKIIMSYLRGKYLALIKPIMVSMPRPY